MAEKAKKEDDAVEELLAFWLDVVSRYRDTPDSLRSQMRQLSVFFKKKKLPPSFYLVRK